MQLGLDTHWRPKYELTFLGGKPRHTYSVVGAPGGVHLHITDYGDEWVEEYGYRYSGGIEIHYRQPPEYMRDDAPSHDNCWLLNAPCWHDGSSLQVTEYWAPLLEGGATPEQMLHHLIGDARSRFRTDED